ncbi:MAG TPA: hypothetical protein P5567_11905 [Kiritimatiellia bacterium]|nr:hypothetical protein [Kiritimatiellia bacterium]HSA17566.1 hypothetical protein [Kiritimatiellia bacterium]
MKTNLIRSVCAAALFLSGSAFGEAYRGEMNAWGTTWMTQDTDFGNIWKVTIQAASNDAPSTYKFDRYGDWVENWGAGSSATKNSTVGTLAGSGGNVSMDAINGRRYSFGMDAGHTEHVVMETDGAPVTPLVATDNHVQDPGTNPVTVSIKLSASLSTQEIVWVRYATNSDFTAARVAPATGSSTNYSATLPGGHNPGARVWYYILTSTMPSNQIMSKPDLCLLRGLKSGSTNFTYRPGGGMCWHHPTNGEPSGATMRNPTNSAAASAAVYFYTGNFWTNGWAMGDQTGATLYHRLKGSGGGWTATNAWFDLESGNNKYWQMRIPSGTYAATNEVEYYIRVTYADYDTTYLGRLTDTASRTFLVEANAQAAPFSFRYGSSTNLGNCWHLPANAEPPTTTMRFPDNPYSNNAVYVYNGNQFQGSGNAADQSGGTLYHRLAGSGGGWTATNLSYDSQQENNKYWVSTIPAGAYKATNQVEYYLRVTYTDRDTTYIGTTNDGAGSLTYASEASAQSNPFRYTYGGEPGTEAGYIWHNSNRVNIASGSVQFWVKIGYAQGIGSNRWVDHACLYYTTNGSAVGVAGKGTGDVNTLAQYLTFDHTEEDASENGNAMWWAGTASGLPLTGTIRYKIGAWNGSGAQRFAEYNTDGVDDMEFSFSLYVSGSEGLTVNGKNADYTTTKFFVNERAGETNYVSAQYTVPGGTAIEKAEIFSNLDRRDYADTDYNGDGIPDGINPPAGGSITTNDTGAYYRAYPMQFLGGRSYCWTGTASKCGAYRLTARYKLAGDTNWYWYSSGGRRDHAIVVSPKKALGMTLYEVNPLTVKATSNDKAGRSTFDDLLDGNLDSFTNFNLGYLNKIQVNCLWFQPIHPSAVTTKGDPSGYDPGSPYATRDYFSVASVLGDADTEADALAEFTNFVHRCDTNASSVGTINVMLDGVFNHTAWDAVMGQGGVDLGYATSATQTMGRTRPAWYAYWQDYGAPATFYNSEYDNDIATAPDRGDFGKWDDVAELYFGKYSALVRHNPDNNGDYNNEGDTYDYAGMDTNTMALWRYFGYYTEYWLKKTGHPTNNNNAAYDDYGIDSLRCDFGQGLPPQLWEYIINRTRKMKWNFVFMAETLDGGSPGYRSNRHFDILNENLVFQFTQAHINYASSLRQALEDRRNSYSSGEVLLNLTGHDEVMADNDPWVVASRYGSVSMVDGLPMIFYGQEWGIEQFNASDPDNKNDGFLNWHELNFGKYIPHFKQWNKLTVWQQPPDYSEGLAQWYGRVNWARLNSPALRSHNRYFLNKVGGGEEGTIMAAAKYQTAYASPQTSDVVLAFSIFFRHGEAHFSTAASFDLTGCWSLLGLDTGKTYRVRNLASSDASAYLTSGWPKTGADLYNNGIYVALGGGTVNPITADGEIVQYLKIEEYTATNHAPAINLPGPHTLPVGSTTSFVVSATDSDGNAVTVTNVTKPSGATYIGTNFSWTALPTAFANTTNALVFVANDGQGATNSIVTNSTVIVVPYDSDSDTLPDGWEWDHFTTLTNGSGGDRDSDGAPNGDEYVAGTQPTNVSSVFEVQSVIVPAGLTNYQVRIPTQPQRHYTIYFRNSLTNGTAWSGFGNTNLGVGTWLETGTVATTFTFTDDQTANTSSNPPPDNRRFYRVRVRQP